MSPHRSSAEQPWPGWTTSRAAQEAWGDHLVQIAVSIPQQLFSFLADRRTLIAAHDSGQPEQLTMEARLVRLEERDDLLHIGAALDVLALCQPPGAYEARPCSDEDELDPAEELRTDAAVVAGYLVRHDRRHGTSRTGSVPQALPDKGATARQMDAVRAYLRAEWLTAEKAQFSSIRQPESL